MLHLSELKNGLLFTIIISFEPLDCEIWKSLEIRMVTPRRRGKIKCMLLNKQLTRDGVSVRRKNFS